jgi:hypothetical protein
VDLLVSARLRMMSIIMSLGLSLLDIWEYQFISENLGITNGKLLKITLVSNQQVG